MHLTLYTDYAIRTLMYLGTKSGRVTPVSEVSAAYGISMHHVAKIAKTLVHLGLVKAHRGKLGGLELAKLPSEINVGEVIRKTEPNLALLECFEPETNTCVIRGACRLQHLLVDAQAAFFKVVDAYTLENLLENPGELRELLPLNVRRAAAVA